MDQHQSRVAHHPMRAQHHPSNVWQSIWQWFILFLCYYIIAEHTLVFLVFASAMKRQVLYLGTLLPPYSISLLGFHTTSSL